MKTSIISLLLLIMLCKYGQTLLKLECPNHCLDCRTNGESTWCLSCLRKKHNYEKPWVQTCQDEPPIQNCVTQSSTLVWNIEEEKEEYVQNCLMCDIAYGFEFLEHQVILGKGSSLSYLKHPARTCKQLPEGTASGFFITNSAGDSDLTATSCSLGKIVISGGCETIPNGHPEQIYQEPIENCIAYNKEGCVRCEPGYELVTSFAGSRKVKVSPYYQSCLKYSENLKGCRISIRPNGSCNGCDFMLGYYAKEVVVDGCPHECIQGQICTDGSHITNVKEL